MCSKIVEFWENDRSIIDEAAQRSIENLPEAGGALGEFVVEAALKAVENLKEEYDPEHGGFLPAPKFPQLQNLLLLLDAAADSSDHKALHIAMHTLKSLLGKGTFDQVGGVCSDTLLMPSSKFLTSKRCSTTTPFTLYSGRVLPLYQGPIL